MAMITSPLPILMFHSVGVPEDRLTIDPTRLEDGLRALDQAGYRLVGLTEALTRAGAGERVVGLTFDDAYADFVDLAMPVLQSVGARVTLYAPVAHLGAPAAWDAGSKTGAPVLDESGLRDVAHAGHEVGSHGNHHVPLDVLPDARVSAEVSTARAILEEIIQSDVPSFCYPHGYASTRTAELVWAAGHSNACVIGYRSFDVGGDPMRVTRLCVTPGSSPQTMLDLVAATHTTLEARAKSVATPAWRIARRAATALRGERA